jgi:hypothetical protein
MPQNRPLIPDQNDNRSSSAYPDGLLGDALALNLVSIQSAYVIKNVLSSKFAQIGCPEQLWYQTGKISY